MNSQVWLYHTCRLTLCVMHIMQLKAFSLFWVRAGKCHKRMQSYTLCGYVSLLLFMEWYNTDKITDDMIMILYSIGPLWVINNQYSELKLPTHHVWTSQKQTPVITTFQQHGKVSSRLKGEQHSGIPGTHCSKRYKQNLFLCSTCTDMHALPYLCMYM